jgi:hypothetical protein
MVFAFHPSYTQQEANLANNFCGFPNFLDAIKEKSSKNFCITALKKWVSVAKSKHALPRG